MPGLHELIAAVLCPRFPAGEQGIDFGDGSERLLPGGFCVFRAQLPVALERVAELRAARGTETGFPYLCSDLERGAGQQISVLTRLPPPLAMGAANSEELARAAGALTAREARAATIAVVLAPVLDLADQPRNPIVAVRAFGADCSSVARLGSAWIAGCETSGARPVAKHFPGHGATLEDSHLVLPTLDRSCQQILATELEPFRTALGSGLPGVMLGHLHVPAFGDTDPVPASLSSKVVENWLRERLGFRGCAFTDALDMGAVLALNADCDPAVRALRAGCDVALMPADPDRSARALRDAVLAGVLDRARLEQAVTRIRELVEPVRVPRQPVLEPEPGGAELALRIARSSVVSMSGALPPLSGHTVDLVAIDDSEGENDLSGLIEALRRQSIRVQVTGESRRPSERVTLAVVFGDVRAWKGRVLLEPDRLARLERLLNGPRPCALLSVGPPQALAEVATPAAGFYVFDQDPASLTAAAEALAGSLAATGRNCWDTTP